MEKRIIANRIRTPDGTIMQSFHVHDFKVYIDANGFEYMVDGGLEYLRRNRVDEAPYKELSIYSNDTFERIREYYKRGGRGKDGKQPLTWVPLSEMNDEWLAACIKYNEERGSGDSFANEMYTKEQEYRKQHNIKINE